MDWWTNKDEVMDQLVTKIEDAISGRYNEIEEDPIRLYVSGQAPVNSDDSSTVTDTDHEETQNEEPESDHTEPEQAKEYIVPYIITPLESASLPVDSVINGQHDEIIKGLIKGVIETEAPITKDLLCKRVLRSINIARMGARVASYMDGLLDELALKKTVDVADVYWRNDQIPEDYPLIRYSNEREAMHIPFEEAKNAALHVLDQQGAQPFESLIREMAKVFGYSRIGDNVYMAMMKGIELAAERSLIDKTSDRVIIKS